MDVAFQLLSGNARLPVKSTSRAAGLDFFASSRVVVRAHSHGVVPTDVVVIWDDESVYLQLFSRSGLFSRHQLSCEAGVIDIDYQQAISVLIQNHSDNDYVIEVGDKVCQGIFLQTATIVNFSIFDEASQSVMNCSTATEVIRSGGFGSTGK